MTNRWPHSISRLRNIGFVTVTLMAILAAGYWFIRHADRKESDKARASVLSHLKDPASAQYRNERFGSKIVCGEINAKNAMGGYIGFKRYISTPTKYAIEGDDLHGWGQLSTELIIVGLDAQTGVLKTLNAGDGSQNWRSADLQRDARVKAQFAAIWARTCGSP